MLTSDNFGVFITPGQRKVFMDEITKTVPQYKQIFREAKTTIPFYHGAHVGGFGLWATNSDGTPIASEDIKQGNNAELIIKRFSKGYTISWELMQDDQLGVFSGQAGVNGSAKLLAKSLRSTIETECANVLSTGFTVAGYDTVSLFNTAHKLNKNTSTPPTGSNMLKATPLTVQGLQDACKLMRSTMDNSGAAPAGAVPGQLIVHPDDEFTARALLGAGLNIVNGIPQAESTLPNLSVVVLDYLTDSTAYFLRAKDMDNLVLAWRETPVFGAQSVPSSVDWFFYGYARFVAGYEEWRGLVGVQKA